MIILKNVKEEWLIKLGTCWGAAAAWSNQLVAVSRAFRTIWYLANVERVHNKKKLRFVWYYLLWTTIVTSAILIFDILIYIVNALFTVVNLHGYYLHYDFNKPQLKCFSVLIQMTENSLNPPFIRPLVHCIKIAVSVSMASSKKEKKKLMESRGVAGQNSSSGFLYTPCSCLDALNHGCTVIEQVPKYTEFLSLTLQTLINVRLHLRILHNSFHWAHEKTRHLLIKKCCLIPYKNKAHCYNFIKIARRLAKPLFLLLLFMHHCVALDLRCSSLHL